MKKIFLTGASSGIGFATAKSLVQRGHEVWGTSRDPARIPAVEGLRAVRLDLCEQGGASQAFGSALEEAGHFDVVINNAGSGHFGPAEFLSDETLRIQFELLVFGQIGLCHLALQAMQPRQRGLIINVTSLASRLPVPFTAAYNAAKAAIASWTMTMQLELGDSPIRIVDLQPGDICTDFNESVRKEEARTPQYQARMDRAWSVVDRNMTHAPKPQLVANRIVELVEETNPPPRVTVGDTFQSVFAPMLFALLPPRLRVWGLRRYYKI
ncbi:MAG: SDR family NAD(P)-dependent oxidoreductase [Chthoniobacterales bacterium]